jgi:hypothetical protein
MIDFLGTCWQRVSAYQGLWLYSFVGLWVPIYRFGMSNMLCHVMILWIELVDPIKKCIWSHLKVTSLVTGLGLSVLALIYSLSLFTYCWSVSSCIVTLDLHLLCQHISHRSLQVWRAQFCSGRLLRIVANKGSHALCSHCSWWSITHSQISQMVPKLSHLDFSSWYHLWLRPLCTLLSFKSPHLDLFYTNVLQLYLLFVISSIW